MAVPGTFFGQGYSKQIALKMLISISTPIILQVAGVSVAKT